MTQNPREDFLVAMFDDEPRLVEELAKYAPEDKPKFSLKGFLITFSLCSLFWTGLILAWLWRKGWL